MTTSAKPFELREIGKSVAVELSGVATSRFRAIVGGTRDEEDVALLVAPSAAMLVVAARPDEPFTVKYGGDRFAKIEYRASGNVKMQEATKASVPFRFPSGRPARQIRDPFPGTDVPAQQGRFEVKLLAQGYRLLRIH